MPPQTKKTGKKITAATSASASAPVSGPDPAAIAEAQEARDEQARIIRARNLRRAEADNAQRAAADHQRQLQRLKAGYKQRLAESDAAAAQPGNKIAVWTAPYDRKLLMVGYGRTLGELDYDRLAKSFVEQPSVEEIRNRFVFLRLKQELKLFEVLNEAVDWLPVERTYLEVPEDAEEDEDEDEDPLLETGDGRTGLDLAREGIPLDVLKAAYEEAKEQQ